MCGIFGLWNLPGQPIQLNELQRATASIRHRGPDDEGYLLVETQARRAVLAGGDDTDPRLALPPVASMTGAPFDLAFGFRRLAILDVSPAGHQPMASADGRYWIVFNGEVYNYLELRRELESLGQTFQSGSDTEVILAAFATWGPDCLKRFVGMWSMAIWDLARQSLFLARDPFGIKPLYVFHRMVPGGRQLAFASEIKALLTLPEVSRKVNAPRLYQYLRSGLTDHGNGTLLEAIRQIPAAHYVEISAAQFASPGHTDSGAPPRPVRYWEIDLERRSDKSLAGAADEVRAQFLENVRLHLRSDVPVGACLSGGIDSSAIVTGMRHLAGPAELDLHTFSYIAADPVLSEERWIDLAANIAAARQHKVHVAPEELVADLDRLIWMQDEPFGGTSIYAQHRVFGLARAAGMTVMLDGQGADELFGGYLDSRSARLASLVRHGQIGEARAFAARIAARHGEAAGATVWREARRFWVPDALGTAARSLAARWRVPEWLDGAWFRAQDVPMAEGFPTGGSDALRFMLHQALTATSVPMLLRYEDRNAMAHSIESRVPFLTTPMAELVMALQEPTIVGPDGETKTVLRRALRGLVPDPILDRQDKIGFATPEKSWLQSLAPWVEGVLASPAAEAVPALRLPAVRAEWRAVVAGERPFDARVWRWVNLIRWAELYDVRFD